MKRVIIIGGGFAGSYIAKGLETMFNVTLIDTKPYFEYTPSILRAVIDTSLPKKLQVKHSRYLKHTKLVTDAVTNVTHTQVKTKSHTFEYDYIIFCTGGRYELPFSSSRLIGINSANELHSYIPKVKAAKTMLVIGGGFVGVELAGELCHDFPEKEVILVHANDTLLGRCARKAVRYADRVLRKKGVKFVFGEKVVKANGDIFVTNKDRKIRADIAFFCAGMVPNTSYIGSSFKHILSERGNIKVNHHLQVQGFKNMFAAGDVTNIREEKTAQNAEHHAKVIIQNIKRMDKSQSLVSYKHKERLMLISLGPKYSILTCQGLVFGGRIPALLKKLVEWHVLHTFKH
ncbi:hypothetical protein CL622_00845 [archaeon]|nr:hypothetical protein [archaeon]